MSGLCVPPDRAPPPVRDPPINCNDEPRPSPEDMYDLPFCVKVGKFPDETEDKKKFELPRTGVLACLRPSSFHDLQSVHRDAYRNFFKL